jgi:hypothetical protein
VQGTASRPIVEGGFIPRNAGQGADLLAISTRVSRTFRVSERVRLEGIAEAFNLLNRRNPVSLNGNFGSGIYPVDPLPGFRQIVSAGDARSAQLAVRVNF